MRYRCISSIGILGTKLQQWASIYDMICIIACSWSHLL